MAQNRLVELQNYGQSVWYDNIERRLILSGELKQMIEEDGVCGVTSNPTIFQKAISGSKEYDETIQALVAQGKEAAEIVDALTIEDIQMAADLFRSVFEGTNGKDGYVSLEPSPKLAYDTDGTVAEIVRLHRLVNRKNVMFKVPSTPQGVPAVERLLGEGININITLLFSVERYEEIAQAYIAALEKLAWEGKSVESVASVASFFVSRVDTAVDALLEKRIEASQDPQEKALLESLLGKAAVANAKVAYQRFKDLFNSPRFSPLKEKGARVQRLLWGSTGTKNPRYSDVLYVDELIGAETVNTLPQATLKTFKDHGTPRASIEEDVEGDRELLRKLEEVGIHMGEVTQKLQDDGVKLFADSFDQLVQETALKREKLLK